jgi:hypothetical protein
MLVSANATAASTGAARTATASVRTSRRRVLFPDTDNRSDGRYFFQITFAVKAAALSLPGLAPGRTNNATIDPHFFRSMVTDCSEVGGTLQREPFWM